LAKSRQYAGALVGPQKHQLSTGSHAFTGGPILALGSIFGRLSLFETKFSGWALGGAAIVAVTLVWNCSSSAAPAPAPPAAAAATPATSSADQARAKATFESLCSSCHEGAVATAQRHDRRGWVEVIERMHGYGMSASPEQMQELADYLAAAYPPG
jgi:hypothetical protein